MISLSLDSGCSPQDEGEGSPFDLGALPHEKLAGVDLGPWTGSERDGMAHLGMLETAARRYRDLSLRTKFACHITVSIALLFAILVPGVVYLQKRTVLVEAQERGLQLTKVFAYYARRPR